MPKTLQEQLESVQNAISNIENGLIEITIGSKRWRKTELPILYQREKDLLARIAEQNGDTKTYCQWGRR